MREPTSTPLFWRSENRVDKLGAMARSAIAARRAAASPLFEQPEDEGEMSESCLCALADGAYRSIGHPTQTAPRKEIDR